MSRNFIAWLTVEAVLNIMIVFFFLNFINLSINRSQEEVVSKINEVWAMSERSEDVNPHNQESIQQSIQKLRNYHEKHKNQSNNEL